MKAFKHGIMITYRDSFSVKGVPELKLPVVDVGKAVSNQSYGLYDYAQTRSCTQMHTCGFAVLLLRTMSDMVADS